MTTRRWGLWGIQVLLAGAVVWFVARSLAGQWAEFRSLDVQLVIRPVHVILAVATVLGTYGVLVGAWRSIVAEWGQHLRLRAAFRIWAVSNLGRYVPGKIWSVAGLAVLAQREGVSPWAAIGSAIVMQMLAIGTGTVMVLATLPTTQSTPLLVAAAVLVGGGVVILTQEGMVTRLARVARRDITVSHLSWRAAVAGAAANLLAWVAYGLSFWLLAEGLLLEHALTLRASVGIFAAGYIVGLLALFAPGGVGVREAMYLALITPMTGGGAALTLVVASRLLLTVTEVLAALTALLAARGRRGTVDQR